MKREIVVLCIGLALVSQVRAQFAEPAGSPPPATQSTSIRVAPHYDYLGSSSIYNREKWLKPEANSTSEVAPEHGKEFPTTNSSSPGGLHWQAGAQHPVLEYKISDQGTLHFHIARHGTTAAAAWSF